MPALPLPPASGLTRAHVLERSELCLAPFDGEERSALRKLENHFERVPTPARILELDELSMRKWKGFGRKSVNRLLQVVVRVLDDLDALHAAFSDAPPDEGPDPFEGAPRLLLEGRALPVVGLSGRSVIPVGTLKGRPEAVGALLEETLDALLPALAPREAVVLRGRLGLGTEDLSLQQVGDRVGLTRERVRHLERDVFTELRSALPVPAASLLAYVENLPLLAAFGALRARFASERHLVQFFEVCVGLPNGTLVDRQLGQTALQMHDLDELFATSPAPLSLLRCLAFLRDQHGLEETAARYRLDHLARRGVVELVGDHVQPRCLTQYAAVAHVLADPAHAKGLPWQSVARLANRDRLAAHALSETRLPHGFASERVYLVGHGRHAHRRFIDHIEEARARPLQRLASALADRDGIANLVELHGELSAASAIDYWVLRHLVRVFGAEVGVHFRSVGGNDTVSFDPPDVAIKLSQIIASALTAAAAPMTEDALLALLPGRSRDHLKTILHALAEEAQVVKTGPGEHWIAERAFRPADLALFRATLAGLLAGDDRPMTVRWLRGALAAATTLDWSEHLVRSAARLLSREGLCDVRATLVSRPDGSFPPSLSALAAAFVDPTAPTLENIRRVEPHVRSVADEVWHAVRSLRAAAARASAPLAGEEAVAG